MNNYLIETYIKYYNKKDEYEKLYKRGFDCLLEEIENQLSILDLKSLMEFYVKYSNIYYLKNNYMNSLLDLIIQNIENKLSNVQIIEIIDVYASLYDSIISVKDNIESYKNIIKVRTYNLNDEFFINNKKSKKFNSNYLEDYKNELNSLKETHDLSISSCNYLNKIEEIIKTSLDNKINELDNASKMNLIRELNTRIELYFKKISFQKNLLKNSKALELEVRLNGLNSYNIIENFNFESLKNILIIYEKYQNMLLENEKKSGK